MKCDEERSIVISVIGLWSMHAMINLQQIYLQLLGRLRFHYDNKYYSVSHDSFNQYVLFFSKQCTYCKTNAIYT